ncbi:MAG: FAD:protein FMN transferase [Thermodesulfobacteriota bacterium]
MADSARARQKSLIAYIIVAAVVFVILAVPLVVKKERTGVVYTRDLMGTLVEFTLMDGAADRFDDAAEAGFAEIARLEGLLSSYSPTSDVTRISNAGGGGGGGGGGPVRVAPEVVEVVLKALEIAELSGGAFDPTIGALAGVWGWSGESGKVPSEEELTRLLPLVDYTRIRVDEGASTVELTGPGRALNLGGVAKGYIVARAIEKLKAGGVTRGIVKAGGDLTVFQTAGRPRPFKIGIRHPRKADKLLGEAFVTSGAVTTSGDYERFFIKDGVRYHHILDPATGMPARGARSVTIVAEDPTRADALSTAVFVMGPKAGMGLIERLPGVEGVIVDSRGRVVRSSGFEGVIYAD